MTTTFNDQPGFEYTLKPNLLKTFADPGLPFLRFDQFISIVQWYRDVHFTPDNVPGFAEDIGKRYLVWTRHSISTYHRHIFPDALREPITISFHLPTPVRRTRLPLSVRMFDSAGLYFEHEQELVLELYNPERERFAIARWTSIPPIRDFVLANCA